MRVPTCGANSGAAIDLSHIRARLQARILAAIEIDRETGCWLWKRRRNNCGYGVLSVYLEGYKHAVKLYAHRVAYFAFKRRPPAGKQIAHSYKCLSPACCNPLHLRATTQASNERDKRRAKEWRLRRLREIFPPTHLAEAPRSSIN